MSGMEFTPPKYAQIVKAIQERIEEGTYVPGELLPSESRLVREFGAGRSTVVRALQILSMQGWIDREHGRGSFVKGKPAAAVEQRTHPGESAFDAPESGAAVFAGRSTVPARIAEGLRLPVESPAILRQRLLVVEGSPSELVSLWFPLDIAAGTDLHRPDPIPVGVRAHLHAVKQLRPTRVVERLSARLPTEEEAKQLGLETGTPVLGILAAVLDASESVLAVADVALPGDLHELEDSYPTS